MKKLFTISLILFSALFISGCIEVDTSVNLNKDGSGTIEEKILMSGAMISMLKEFTNAFASDSSKKEEFNIYDPKELESKASTYGEGVKFVSGEKIKDGEREGFKAVYSFTDINKLKLDQNPGSQVPMGMGSEANEKKELFTFQFEPGNPANVIIHMPKNQMKEKEEETEKDTSQNSQENIEKVKEIMKDMKISLKLNINGKITSTNASYVNGSNITLFKINFNDLLDNPEKLKELQSKNPQSLEEMRELVKGIKGIKIEFNNPVEVSFN